MSKEANHLHDVIDMLTRLSNHYNECSLELAQQKEQHAAEWDALVDCEHDYQKERCASEDGEDYGFAWICSKCDDQVDSMEEEYSPSENA